MAQTIELVVVPEVRKASVHAVDYVVSIEIPGRQLRGADDVYRPVSGLFEYFIGVRCKSISDSFDPFIEVAVLEHKAVEFRILGVFPAVRKDREASVSILGGFVAATLFSGLLIKRCCRLEIMHAVARLSLRDAVV